MDTPTAVLVSQIPLAIVCIIAVYEIHKIRKELEKMRASSEKRVKK